MSNQEEFNVIDEKVTKITNLWTDYFLETESLQRKINFTKEVESNYFGEIIHYLSDTLHLVQFPEKTENLASEIYNVTAVLQLIYVQQDLIGELLYIFKLDKDQLLSNCEHRNFNRNIRNELVGHPIKRNKNANNTLTSSALYLPIPNSEYLEYRIYHIEDDYAGKNYKIKKSEIIDNHVNFLNKFLDLILRKISQLVKTHVLKLQELLKLIDKQGIFPNTIKLICSEHKFLLNNTPLNKYDIIEEIKKLSSDHPRYSNAVKRLEANLLEDLLLRIISLIPETPLTVPDDIQIRYKELVSSRSKPTLGHNSKPNNYRYYLSKLHGNNWEFGANMLEREFSKVDLIVEEIDFLRKNKRVKVHYYCSCLYLNKLILN